MKFRTTGKVVLREEEEMNSRRKAENYIQIFTLKED